MGKGTVASGGAGGLYTINLDYGKTRVDSRIAALTSAISTLQTKYTDQYAEYLTERSTLEALTAALDSAISAYASVSTPESRQAVVEATKAQSAQSARTSQAKSKAEAIQLQLAATEKDKARLQNIVTQETKSAWCVDLTETASGQVATLEVPGEPQRILIAPGARVPTSADGQLLARAAMSPEQAFYNAAILPGVQKHKPNFRVGTITAINATLDLADVTLDAATSSANSLGINIMTELVGIPVQYMTCHAGAFEVGDRVIVQFTGLAWENPKVIGFLQNPKACTSMMIGMSDQNSGLVYVHDLKPETFEIKETIFISQSAGATSAGLVRHQNKVWSLDGLRYGSPVSSTTFRLLSNNTGESITLASPVLRPSVDGGEVIGLSFDSEYLQDKIIVHNMATGAFVRNIYIPHHITGSPVQLYGWEPVGFPEICDSFLGKTIVYGIHPSTSGGLSKNILTVVNHSTSEVVANVEMADYTYALAACVGRDYFAYVKRVLGASYVTLVVCNMAGAQLSETTLTGIYSPFGGAFVKMKMAGNHVFIQSPVTSPSYSFGGQTRKYTISIGGSVTLDDDVLLFDSLITRSTPSYPFASR